MQGLWLLSQSSSSSGLQQQVHSLCSISSSSSSNFYFCMRLTCRLHCPHKSTKTARLTFWVWMSSPPPSSHPSHCRTFRFSPPCLCCQWKSDGSSWQHILKTGTKVRRQCDNSEYLQRQALLTPFLFADYNCQAELEQAVSSRAAWNVRLLTLFVEKERKQTSSLRGLMSNSCMKT